MTNKVSVKRSALVEQPLKTSAATGATLACMGLDNSIPLMHGSQGCGAFAKVYLIQHYREPIPLQNTAIDHIAAVMGGDDNLSSALKLLCEKHQAALVVVMTTGLTEMQGCDVTRVVREFKTQHPQFSNKRIVSVNTPDFTGSMQSGFASTIEACMQQLLVEKQLSVPKLDSNIQQLNVFVSCALTSADLELIARYCEAFGFNPVLVPNLSDSLDGHLADDDFSVTSTGGTGLSQLASCIHSKASLVFGESMLSAARVLEKHYQVPSLFMGTGMGMQQTDQLVMKLAELSNKPVPQWITRQRKRLQDALLDSHFLLSDAKVAIALEPDLAAGYCEVFSEVGASVERVVTTLNMTSLPLLKTNSVVVGDLSDLEPCVDECELIVGNTHCANMCEPLTPVLRAGFPCHDRFGISDILQVGYEGARQRLFAMANLLKASHQDEVPAHKSSYRFEPSSCTQPALSS